MSAFAQGLRNSNWRGTPFAFRQAVRLASLRWSLWVRVPRPMEMGCRLTEYLAWDMGNVHSTFDRFGDLLASQFKETSSRL